MWEMTQCDRLVYLDADMILLKSIGELISCSAQARAGWVRAGRRATHWSEQSPPEI